MLFGLSACARVLSMRTRVDLQKKQKTKMKEREIDFYQARDTHNKPNTTLLLTCIRQLQTKIGKTEKNQTQNSSIYK